MSTIQEFDPSVDVLRVLLWQYNKAENLEGILTLKQNWYDLYHSDFWSDWVVNVFDLRTANEFGLGVWAIILDLPLFTTGEASPADYPAFGFADYQGNFFNYNFAISDGSVVSLTLEQKRIVLRMRYFALTTNCTVPSINRFLKYLFGDGVAYIEDNLDMTAKYKFTVFQEPELLEAITLLDVWPRPSTVNLTIENGP
jgi:hypothetical protein